MAGRETEDVKTRLVEVTDREIEGVVTRLVEEADRETKDIGIRFVEAADCEVEEQVSLGAFRLAGFIVSTNVTVPVSTEYKMSV